MPICAPSDIWSGQNSPKTVEPFHEFRLAKEYSQPPMFSVSRRPKDGLIPLFSVYMSLTQDDPSETTFVEDVFGDWYYWAALSQSAQFKPILEEWRHFAAIKRKQKAFKTIVEEMKSDRPSRFAAAKYLIEEPWKGGLTASERKKIRKQTQETTEEAFKQSLVAEDIQRLKEEGLIN